MSPIESAHAVSPWVSRLAAGIREEWAWLAGGLLLVGLALLSLGLFGLLPVRGLSGFVGSFLALYAVLVLLQGPHSAILGAGLKQRLQRAIVNSGVGFYGVVTLARFLQLELHDVLAALREFELTRSQMQGMLRDWLIGFSIQSLMNSIDAMLWPFKLMNAHGMVTAAIVVAPLWALYRLGGMLFPELHALIEAEADDDGSPPAPGGGAAAAPPPPAPP